MLDSEKSSDYVKREKSETLVQDVVQKSMVVAVVARSFGPTFRLVDYQVKSYSNEKLGIMSDYKSLVATVQKDGQVERVTRSYFVKFVPYGVESLVSFIDETRTFVKEVAFYRSILPELTTGLKDKSWIADCYFSKDDLLIFEDLRIRKYAVKLKPHLDVTELKSALATLARLHGSSLLAEKRLGKSFGAIYPEALRECIFTGVGAAHEIYRTGMNVLVAIAERYHLDHSGFTRVCELMFDLIKESKTRRNVICHGDCRSFNLLFDDSSPVANCALVDFQFIRYCPAMVDVSQIVYLNTRLDDRRGHERQLLKHYQEQLRDFLRDHDEEIDVPALADVLEEYEEMRIVGLASTALYSPITLADTSKNADVMGDSDQFAQALYGDRSDMVLAYMEQNDYYKDVLIEIVTELIQRSKQLLKQ